MARKITLTKEQVSELKKLAEYSRNADEAKKIRERFKAFTEDNFDALKEGIDIDGLVLGVKVTKQLTVKEA